MRPWSFEVQESWGRDYRATRETDDSYTSLLDAEQIRMTPKKNQISVHVSISSRLGHELAVTLTCEPTRVHDGSSVGPNGGGLKSIPAASDGGHQDP